MVHCRLVQTKELKDFCGVKTPWKIPFLLLPELRVSAAALGDTPTILPQVATERQTTINTLKVDLNV